MVVVVRGAITDYCLEHDGWLRGVDLGPHPFFPGMASQLVYFPMFCEENR
jgi:hypothetical protein